MGGSNVIDVPLTATKVNGRVVVSGDGSAVLPANSGAFRFNFTLSDGTGLNVKFASLDAQDNQSTCPPAPGENSQQITGVSMQNGTTPRRAAFTDNNNNKNGAMDVCYQWNFTCDDPAVVVEPFDPIIRNGGETLA